MKITIIFRFVRHLLDELGFTQLKTTLPHSPTCCRAPVMLPGCGTLQVRVFFLRQQRFRYIFYSDVTSNSVVTSSNIRALTETPL